MSDQSKSSSAADRYKDKQAFVIRCAPSYNSRLDEVVNDNEIMIGWAWTKDELLDPALNRNGFKKIIVKHYPRYAKKSRSLGQAAGYLWRFIREMQIGDLALIPTSGAFYLAEVTGEVYCDESRVEADTAIRRGVKLLSDIPIPRSLCANGLISRLKYQGTCVSATDRLEQVIQAFERHRTGMKPSYQEELREELREKVSAFLRSDSNLLNSDSMESLVHDLMGAIGAEECLIPSKSRYPVGTDVDVIAHFHKLQTTICIQVKKHNESTGSHSIRQIVKAIPHIEEEFNYQTQAWVVNTGEFNEEARELAETEKIRLINGDDLAEMILDAGLERIFLNSTT